MNIISCLIFTFGEGTLESGTLNDKHRLDFWQMLGFVACIYVPTYLPLILHIFFHRTHFSCDRAKPGFKGILGERWFTTKPQRNSLKLRSEGEETGMSTMKKKREEQFASGVCQQLHNNVVLRGKWFSRDDLKRNETTLPFYLLSFLLSLNAESLNISAITARRNESNRVCMGDTSEKYSTSSKYDAIAWCEQY